MTKDTNTAIGAADDSLLLCASDLQHSAIYDNHVQMQACIRAVADRIAALASAAAPAAVASPGWKLVPVEPTPEMWKAARAVPDPNPPYPPHYALVWDAMLAAAPSTQSATQLPERDASIPAEQQGLFRKFDVRRVDGTDKPGAKHHGCTYFVLDVDHDPCARPALAAYAAACEATHPALADDLRTKWSAPPTSARSAA